MIQFNLLPDVKMEYIKARRSKRVVMVVSALVSGTALTIFILLFLAVSYFQKNHSENLSVDIKKDAQTLQEMPELNKILTVQNQLISLPGLHDKKPVASRLPGFISQITPTQITIAKLNVDFPTYKITINGATDSLSSVNKFIDTMKFTEFTASDPRVKNKAFSDVEMKDFTRDEKGTTYEISLSFDPAIFDSASPVILIVPKIVSTRSEVEKPSPLFQQPAQPNQDEER